MRQPQAPIEPAAGAVSGVMADEASAPEAMARTDPRQGGARRRYKIRGPETWALVRESYLAGASARELAMRYDVTEWAIWRRAWKQGWTKDNRVEASPPPALEPVTPDIEAGSEGEEADAAALARLALRGVASALRQNRLTEARSLSQIAASLDRIADASSGAGPGAKTGGYGLADLLRMMLDEGFVNDVMFLAYESEDPDVARLREQMEPQREANGRGMAALRSRGYAEGRSDLRQELGLAAEEGLPDAWVWSNGVMMRHSVLEQLRKEWTLVPMPVEGAEDEGD